MPEEQTMSAISLPTVDDVKSQREPKVNANDEHDKSLSPLERYALWITDHVGTMGFFLLILGWTVVWMGWNALAPKKLVFDKGWEFGVWLFISNLIQIHLMPLIMIGQNLQARHAQFLTEHQVQITEQTENEMEVVLLYLEALQQTVQRLEHRLTAAERGRNLST